MPDKWLAVPTLKPFQGLKSEVQVRTMAQHVWSEASHTLQYKQEASVPRALLRSIYRLSALLETVDLEFERVLDERQQYRTRIELTDTSENLNVDLLELTLDSLLPAANKDYDEDYEGLLDSLKRFEIKNVFQLKALLDRRLERVLQEDKKMAQYVKGRHGRDAPERVVERAQKGVTLSHTELAKTALRYEVGNESYYSNLIEQDEAFSKLDLI